MEEFSTIAGARASSAAICNVAALLAGSLALSSLGFSQLFDHLLSEQRLRNAFMGTGPGEGSGDRPPDNATCGRLGTGPGLGAFILLSS